MRVFIGRKKFISFFRIYKEKLLIFILILIFCILFSYRHSTVQNKISQLVDKRKYAVLIDCGSSGSRMYIYYWSESEEFGEAPMIHRLKDASGDVISFKVKPGISTFSTSPSNAAPYLLELIEKSYLHIPKSERVLTPLYILATAGMRLLDQVSIDAIISSVETLRNTIDFSIKKIEVIPGSTEGFFSWIALNYILKNFQLHCGFTSGMIEVGGGSMQIAFETGHRSDNTLSFSYRCSLTGELVTHHVYSVTFLGLGVNSALITYNQNKESLYLDSKYDACMPLECPTGPKLPRKRGSGDLEVCYSSIIDMFDTYMKQQAESTFFETYKEQLVIALNFSNMSFYGLSELWYGFNDFLHYNGPLLPHLYWAKSKDFCSTKCSKLSFNLLRGLYTSNSQHLLKLQCFKAAFLRFVVNKFLPNMQSTPVINIHDHAGEEIEWTYGAIVYFISQHN